MRKLLNTLYVTTPESYLSRDGMNVVISVKQQEVFRIPVINLESIVTFGFVGASPGLMCLCADNGVSLTFLSPHGRFVSRVQGPTKGNVLLRKAQFHLTEDEEWSTHLARLIVAGKIQNSRNVLRRFVRDYGTNAEVEGAAEALDSERREALKSKDRSALMGVEGMAANCYFSVFSNLILQQKTTSLLTVGIAVRQKMLLMLCCHSHILCLPMKLLRHWRRLVWILTLGFTTRCVRDGHRWP